MLFVADILVFCDGSKQDLDKLDQGLNLIRIVAWMVINEGKSSTVRANLEPHDLHLLMIRFLFRIRDLDEGIKYLGFLLNPKDYQKKDWDWLVAKIEKRLNLWSHGWISRVGRLVLIKSILEAIPIYKASMSWIPKGILEKIRWICFSYLWQGKKERKVLPWVIWDRIAILEALGGWGLRNIFLFFKSLAAKMGWRLISTNSLCTKVISQKYISPGSIMEWIRDPNKSHAGVSIIWKVLIASSGIIKDVLAWKVGNGRNFHIGLDP